jgi:enoyl-CoA hydratase
MAIELTRIEEFAVLTLNRPDALNALSFALIEELGRAFEQVHGGDARALIITGAGGPGVLRRRRHQGADRTPSLAQKRGGEAGQYIFSKLDRLPMPSVAVINGYAFGGGSSWRSPARSVSSRRKRRWDCRRSSWA